MHQRVCLSVGALLFSCLAGCSSTGSRDTLARCQSEKEQLAAQVANLQQQQQQIEQQKQLLAARLADSERQLARVYDGSAPLYPPAQLPSTPTLTASQLPASTSLRAAQPELPLTAPDGAWRPVQRSSTR